MVQLLARRAQLPPFVATLRELLEMRYLWQQPVRMDNCRLVGLLGAEPHTSLDEAIEQTLEGMGCLEGGNPAPARERTTWA